MAVRHGYGKVAGTDALVFAYDTGDTRNSYKGEPTENLITASGLNFTVMSTYGFIARTQVVDTASPSGYACEMEVQDAAQINNSSRIRFGDATNIPTSGNAFVSVWVRFEGGPTSNIVPRVYTGTAWWDLSPLDGGSQYLTSEYRRFGVYTSLGTGSGGPNPGFSMTQNNSNVQTGQKTRWHSPQVEIKSHVTPFTSGTRSATQGLLDLTGNNSIDLSSVTFDSNADIDLDGTDDYIETADSSLLDLTTDMSFEFVVNADSSQGNLFPRLIDKSVYLVHLTQTSPFTIAQNITTSSGLRQTALGSAFTAGVYAHIVTTYDGRYGQIFVNGELKYTRDFSTESACTTNSTSVKFGGNGDTGRPLNGKLPVAKVYNRVLTAAEVKNNYRNYKGRFNI